MNFESKNENGINDIMNVIAPTFLKNECVDIGKKWIRKCPKCAKEIIHTSYKSFKISTKKNPLCSHCGCVEREKRRDKSMYQNPEYRKKLSDALKISRRDKTKFGEVFREQCRNNAKTQWTTDDIREKMEKKMKSYEYRSAHRNNSLKMWGTASHISHMKEIHSSDEYREKRRLITRKILKQKLGNGRISSYSKKACLCIDKIGHLLGYLFQHGENGGEYEIGGYALDGYDKNKNVILEYDEPHHYDFNGNLKPKDVRRQNDLIKALNPSVFLRYNEKRNVLYNVLDGRILWQ
jgi:hypothetical protein